MASNLPQSPLNAFLSSLPGYAMNLQQMARQSQEQERARQFQGQQAQMNRTAQYKQFAERLEQEEDQFRDEFGKNAEFEERKLAIGEAAAKRQKDEANIAKIKSILQGNLGQYADEFSNPGDVDPVMWNDEGVPEIDANIWESARISPYELDQQYKEKLYTPEIQKMIEDAGLTGSEGLIFSGLGDNGFTDSIIGAREEGIAGLLQGDINEWIKRSGETDVKKQQLMADMLYSSTSGGIDPRENGLNLPYLWAAGATSDDLVQRASMFPDVNQQQKTTYQQEPGQPNMEMYNQYKGYRGIR